VGKKRSSDASRRYFFLYRESATDFVVVAAITTSITSWLSRTAPSTTTTGIGNDSSTIYVCTNDLCAPWRQLSVASTTGGADIEKEREYGK
jgi:hypothetical protein